MKLIALVLLTASLLSACVTDAAGHKVYTGPTLALNFGYNGATVGIGIVGQPVPTKPEVASGFAK